MGTYKLKLITDLIRNFKKMKLNLITKGSLKETEKKLKTLFHHQVDHTKNFPLTNFNKTTLKIFQ